MYRTYSMNDMPQPIGRRDREEYTHTGEVNAAPGAALPAREAASDTETIESLPRECDEVNDEHRPSGDKFTGNSEGLLSNINFDDIIFAVILMLIADDCDDKLLIIALGFVLFSDFFGF